MICMNYDHNKKFGLLNFHSGYGNFYFNSPKGYNRKIINVQTAGGHSDGDGLLVWNSKPHSHLYLLFLVNNMNIIITLAIISS